jgi:hypothetical protein
VAERRYRTLWKESSDSIMNTYEIRIVRQSDQAQLVVTVSVMGDHAAIRRARTLAGEGDLLEVWRGMRCVFSTFRESVH